MKSITESKSADLNDDGHNDFEDVMIARMMASGVPKSVAVAKGTAAAKKSKKKVNERFDLITEEASRIKEDEARSLLKDYSSDVEEVLNIDASRLKPAGVGTRGVVFDVGDGRILKLTRDDTEARIASSLVGNDNENLTRYYEVVRFGDTDVYGILQEKLTPLTNEEIKTLNNALVKTRLPVWIYKSGYDFDKAKEMTKQYIKDEYKKFVDGKKFSEAKAWINEINPLWNLLSREYKIRGLAAALKELGIDFHDYHGGNFMRRGNTLVLIDLGYSRGFSGSGSIKSLRASRKSESRRALSVIGEACIRTLHRR
jgi:hypothetical protein